MNWATHGKTAPAHPRDRHIQSERRRHRSEVESLSPHSFDRQKIISKDSHCLRCKLTICSPKCVADIPCRSFVLISMDEYSPPRGGKINVHGHGLGAPTPEEVENRAREIALIDERDPDE